MQQRYNPLRKHSMTSFYVKPYHHTNPSPIRHPNVDQIESLQNLIRMQQKEIERLEHQNKNLMILTNHQTNMIYQERSFRVRSNKSIAEPALQKDDSVKKMENKQQIKSASEKATLSVRKPAISRRLSVLFQKDDTFKLPQILDENIKDADAIQYYENDGSISLLNDILNDEDSFTDVVQNYPAQKVSIIYDKLKKIFQEHAIMFQMILKLKAILMNAFQISKSKILDEAFTLLNTCSIKSMDCKEVQIYLMDEDKKQLYSNTSNKRYNLGEGLVGYVAESRELLNIKNAKYDSRFQSDNYNVVLACPITDQTKCYGVILCVDKNSGQFNQEDEGILKLLTEQAKIILNNILSHDQLVMSINKFRHTLQSSLQFIQQINTQKSLPDLAAQRLKALMNADFASVKLKEQIKGLGIMGQSLETKQFIQTINSYNSPYYHPDVDINAQLPVIAYPIIYNTQPIGGMEFSLVKGVMHSSISSIEQEVLDLFSKILGNCIELQKQLVK